MFCICVLIIAAAAVYMVEAYIHTYYAIEYMHGAPLFFVLLAKYAAPVLFLLLCVSRIMANVEHDSDKIGNLAFYFFTYILEVLERPLG